MVLTMPSPHGSINQLAGDLVHLENVMEVSGTVKDLKELFSGEQLRLLDAVAQALIANPQAFEGASHVAQEAGE